MYQNKVEIGKTSDSKFDFSTDLIINSGETIFRLRGFLKTELLTKIISKISTAYSEKRTTTTIQ